MNAMETVLVGIFSIVGIVIYYVVWNQYQENLGIAGPLLALLPLLMGAGAVFYALASFGSKK